MKKEEGPKGFNTTLAELDSGAFHSDASKELQKLTAELTRQANTYQRETKGDMTIKISIAVKPGGVAHLSASVDAKAPKITRPGSTFFVTEGHNLSVKNPRQTELPLHALPDQPVEDVPAVNQPMQGV